MTLNRKIFDDAKHGDASAIQELMNICSPLIESECRKLGISSLAAITVSDLTQEATLHVLDKLPDFDGDNSPNPLASFLRWVRIVTRNFLLNLVDKLERRSGKEQQNPSPMERLKADGGDTVSIGSVVARKEEFNRVVEAVETHLDKTSQRIIRLRVFECRSFQQIAEALDLSVDQVRYRFHQALAKLNTKLGY